MIRSSRGTRSSASRAALGAAAVLLTLASGCASTNEYDPFQVPREQFRRTVRTIALQPPTLPPGTPNAPAVRRDLESRIEAKLRGLGYEVVPSTEFEQIWRGMSESVGGVYDERTGARREERHAAVREHALNELRVRHGVDALLNASVYLHRMQAVRSWMHYVIPGGEKLIWQGEPIGATVDAQPQLVIGSWLGITISDLDGVKLYSVGWILEWTEIYAAGSHETRDESEWFSDEAHIQNAVDGTMGLLVAPSRKR